MILDIVTYPDPRLKQPCEPVTEVTDEIRKLAADMLETMYAAPGVGLAAPQVGRNIRMLVMDPAGKDEDKQPRVLINPVLELSGEDVVSEQEGCLSVPGVYGYVTRPTWAKIRAQDRNGNWFEREGEGIVAQCFCHETEHLDGHLFTEKVEEYIDPEAMQGGDEE